MANQIEKLNRMRKYIVRGVFFGTAIGLTWLLLPYLKLTKYNTFRDYLNNFNQAFYGAVYVWFATILVFGLIFWLYKKKLKKNPRLRAAVYDERVILNWLKAHRFAFLITFSITIIWKSYEYATITPRLLGGLRMPWGPPLILSVAVTALTGAFLFYNREAKNE